MAQNVTIQGATYSAVPAVELPKQGGGTATFTDVTDTTATASDVASGTYFYTAAGVRTEGTASGGGGGGSITQDADGYLVLDPNGGGGGGSGLEYEEGTWTPSEDVARGTISYTNQHDSIPIMFAIGDVGSGDGLTANTNTFCCFIYSYEIFGAGVPYNTGAYFRYAHGVANYINSNNATTSYAYNCGLNGNDDDGSTSNMPSYWATASEFHPYSGSNSRLWRAGRTYKWIAVWAPQS